MTLEQKLKTDLHALFDVLPIIKIQNEESFSVVFQERITNVNIVYNYTFHSTDEECLVNFEVVATMDLQYTTKKLFSSFPKYTLKKLSKNLIEVRNKETKWKFPELAYDEIITIIKQMRQFSTLKIYEIYAFACDIPYRTRKFTFKTIVNNFGGKILYQDSNTKAFYFQDTSRRQSFSIEIEKPKDSRIMMNIITRGFRQDISKVSYFDGVTRTRGDVVECYTSIELKLPKGDATQYITDNLRNMFEAPKPVQRFVLSLKDLGFNQVDMYWKKIFNDFDMHHIGLERNKFLIVQGSTENIRNREKLVYAFSKDKFNIDRTTNYLLKKILATPAKEVELLIYNIEEGSWKGAIAHIEDDTTNVIIRGEE